MTRENALALQTTQNEKFNRIKQTFKKKQTILRFFYLQTGQIIASKSNTIHYCRYQLNMLCKRML